MSSRENYLYCESYITHNFIYVETNTVKRFFQSVDLNKSIEVACFHNIIDQSKRKKRKYIKTNVVVKVIKNNMLKQCVCANIVMI